VIRGTRIAVELILELLAEDCSRDEVVRNYPALSVEDIQASLRSASETLKRERVYPLAV
jgi:uncharacterized protein (DUF433 family)